MAGRAGRWSRLQLAWLAPLEQLAAWAHSLLNDVDQRCKRRPAWEEKSSQPTSGALKTWLGKTSSLSTSCDFGRV